MPETELWSRWAVEADVLEQDDVARLRGRTGGLDRGANAVVEELHRLAEQLAEALGHGRERELQLALAVGASEVAHEDDGRALVEQVVDRRQRRGDALVVFDFSVFDGNVEVDAHEDALAGHREIFDEQFGHGGVFSHYHFPPTRSTVLLDARRAP
jgi:hypothetical protein